jgi:hypothetical protein
MVFPRTETYKVPPAYQAKIEEGINAAATDWNVTLDPGVSYSWKKEAIRTGNRPIAKSTQDTYINHYKQLWYFFAMVGAYDSMLILTEPKPRRAPAMEMEYLQAFLRWKRQPPGTPLTFEAGEADGVPIMNVFGDQVLCEGAWNAPDKASQCTSAISVLHTTRGHTGPYMERCDECTKLTGAARLAGCDLHFNEGANLYRKGNPTDELYKTRRSCFKRPGMLTKLMEPRSFCPRTFVVSADIYFRRTI